LDMQLAVSLLDLVDDDTTFMTAKSQFGGALNAIIATVPHNLVMLNTLSAMVEWYNEGWHSDEELLGPVTMQRGIEKTLSTDCPEHKWEDAHAHFKCGPNNAIRLFQEQRLSNCEKWGKTVCPSMRARSKFEGQKFVMMDSIGKDRRDVMNPSAKDVARREQMFFGWPRFDGCDRWGCGLTSHPDIPRNELLETLKVQFEQERSRAHVAEEMARVADETTKKMKRDELNLLAELSKRNAAALQMSELRTQKAEERAVLADERAQHDEEALEDERKLARSHRSQFGAKTD